MNHGIPQNQRHTTRHANPRTQKHPKHPDLRAACRSSIPGPARIRN